MKNSEWKLEDKYEANTAIVKHIKIDLDKKQDKVGEPIKEESSFEELSMMGNVQGGSGVPTANVTFCTEIKPNDMINDTREFGN